MRLIVCLLTTPGLARASRTGPGLPDCEWPGTTGPLSIHLSSVSAPLGDVPVRLSRGTGPLPSEQLSGRQATAGRRARGHGHGAVDCLDQNFGW